MVSWKHFFLDNPNWPQPGVAYLPTTWINLSGVGRVILFSLLAEWLWKSIW